MIVIWGKPVHNRGNFSGGKENEKNYLVVCMGLSLNAIAFPEAPFDALVTPVDSIKFMDDDSGFDYDFEGIVKLSNCSGSVIRFSGQPDTTQAYVLTNGHCLGGRLLQPGVVVYNRDVNRKMKVSDKLMSFTDVTAKKLIYATMTNTDAAIYELSETYQDLAQRGVEPFLLAADRPLVGLPIDVVSGYWERGYRCHIAAFVFQLREHTYIFTDSIRYSDDGCKIIGGTSGSPVIEKGTRVVVGVNNTANESGKMCTLNNPCEVDDDGNIQVLPSTGYGQQTYQFSTCLTPDFKIDLSLDTCELPKP